MGYSRSLYKISLGLARWAVFSVTAGTVTLFFVSPYVRGFGLQGIAWGAVNLVLAGRGLSRSRRWNQRTPDETSDVRETVRLRKVLRVNAFLDILYTLAGFAVVFFFRSRPFLVGTGTGIIFQALFLFFFDRTHTRRLPSAPPVWYDPAL